MDNKDQSGHHFIPYNHNIICFTHPRIREFAESLLCTLTAAAINEVTNEKAFLKDSRIKGFLNEYIQAASNISPACPIDHNRISWYVETLCCQLPTIIEAINQDVEAATQNDPAIKSRQEILLTYPGIKAILLHRLAHQILQLDIPIIPRALSEYAHSLTGIDIHPGAQINRYFFIDHGTGVVIGETAVIGQHVSIYQGVTLGTKNIKKDKNNNIITGAKRHPTVENNVTIYANTTILGDTTIGEGSIIGSNVSITRSIPPGSKVAQQQYQHGYVEGGLGI